jgi:hypothetical protein
MSYMAQVVWTLGNGCLVTSPAFGYPELVGDAEGYEAVYESPRYEFWVSDQFESQVVGNSQGGVVVDSGKEATPGRGTTAAGVDVFACSIKSLYLCSVFTAVVSEYVAGTFQDY